MRNELKSDERVIDFEDYGASLSSDLDSKPVVKSNSISSIYERAAIPLSWSTFLFRLIYNWKPRNVLELGTNLGTGSAYLQSALDLAGQEGRLWTLEGAEALARVAEEYLTRYCSKTPEIVVGPFNRSLEQTLQQMETVSLCFIDGHHTEEATMHYYHTIKPHLSEKAIIIFDDVEPWSPVNRAWTRLKREESDFESIYLLKKGLLVR